MVIISPFLQQLEGPSQSPSFWILERPGSRFLLSLQTSPWVSVPGFHQLLQLRLSWLEWERKEIEEDFGERDPAPALVWELTHTLSISPHPACCAWVLCFPVESFLYFPLNQSMLGNINQGIMTNLSMWERKDVAAVFREHLGSSYSRERARGLH